MTGIRILGALEPTFAWDGSRLYSAGDLGPAVQVPPGLRGAASLVTRDDAGNWRVLRDPLGINKLFWGYDDAGMATFATTPRTLVDAGIPFDAVSAAPTGCVLDLNPVQQSRKSWSLVPDSWRSVSKAAADIQTTGARIRAAMDQYLAAVAAAHPHDRVFVCLSGGLDSSGIAAIARPHFGSLTAVSFDLDRPDGRSSEDRRTAERLAGDLGLPLWSVTVTEDELFRHLDTVLVEGIDWRDFNVHAGLVNAVLAAHIDELAPEVAGAGAGGRLVLTGDLANEFLADYHPESYRGRTYYGLPRLSGAALRASLVRGVATSHREIGVFAARGLALIQPYAVAVDAYMTLTDPFFDREDRKQQLCRAIFGDALPEYVYTRKKARAQVGDAHAGSGVLSAAVDRGIDAAWLRQRFAELHGVHDNKALGRFLRAGNYRSAIPFADQEVQRGRHPAHIR
ncbi:MAG: asparagine synthase-related protein [Pseudomonadales bacterium]